MADYTDVVMLDHDVMALPRPDDVATYQAVADDVPPYASLVAPAPGVPLGRTDVVVVNVADNQALSTVFVWAVYDDGSDELIYNGDAFSKRFTQSAATVLSTSLRRFSIVRTGGWLRSPTIHVKPVDRSGNST